MLPYDDREILPPGGRRTASLDEDDPPPETLAAPVGPMSARQSASSRGPAYTSIAREAPRTSTATSGRPRGLTAAAHARSTAASTDASTANGSGCQGSAMSAN